MINKVQKVWGEELWYVNNEKYAAKQLILNKGYQCSLHYHAKKDETFYILEGVVELEVVDLGKHMTILPWATQEEIDEIHSEAIALKEAYLKDLELIFLHPGQSFRLRPFIAHRFSSVGPTAKILEISTTHEDSDSYRLTESARI